MQITKHYCDRCKKEMPMPEYCLGASSSDTHAVQEIRTVVSNAPFPGANTRRRFNLDICLECSSKLTSWMEQPL